MGTDILIVDEEKQVRHQLKTMLHGDEFKIHEASDGQQALQAFETKAYDVLVIEPVLSDINGTEVIKKIKKTDKTVEIIILTDYSNIGYVLDSLSDYKMLDFLFKPLKNPKLVRYIVLKALERCRVQKSLENFYNNKKNALIKSFFKSDFLADMRHELRNPLNSILGFSQVLLEKYFGPLNDKQEKYINDIHESGQDLLTLIDDILDLTRLESENDRLELTHVNICKLVKNSLNFIHQKAFKHGVDIRLSMSEDLHQLILILDKKKMKQILFNLLSNALSFTSDGGFVTINVSKTVISHRESVIIFVSGGNTDTETENRLPSFHKMEGPGFDPQGEHLQDPSLYLTLTKKLVEMQGGSFYANCLPEKQEYFFTIIFPVESHPSKVY